MEFDPLAETDPLAAGLRAFAASLMAEYGKGAAASEDNPRTAGLRAPAAMPPLPAPVPVPAKPTRNMEPEIVLPLAAAPPLGSVPQRPAQLLPTPPASPSARPAERREGEKSDIAEDLFADVMGLSDEERIALFT